MSLRIVITLILFSICHGVPLKDAVSDEGTPDVFPWTVSILNSDAELCSGVLISPTRVLTSAQCTTDVYSKQIFFGSRQVLGGIQQRRAKFQYIHPGFKSEGLLNDLARLDFVEPIEITDKVYPIGLPKKLTANLPEEGRGDHNDNQEYETYEGVEAIISGWGTANEMNDTANSLSDNVTVTVISNSQCAESKFSYFVTDAIICSYGQDKTQNLCTGDAGSGLFYFDSDNSPILLGIGSFTNPDGCDVYNSTSGFTRVSHYMEWITADEPSTSTASATVAFSCSLIFICLLGKLL